MCLSENRFPFRSSLADPSVSESPEDTAAELNISGADRTVVGSTLQSTER